MPRKAEYQIVWSKMNGYELFHGPFSFFLAGADTVAYWLDRVETLHFCSSTGYSMTLRKERKQRGAGYWYAYKRINGKVCKKYLGTKEHISLTLLETVARHFIEPQPEPEPQATQPPPRKPTLTFTRTLESALAIYGFQSLPTKRELITKYRELSKKHHPDTGGLHQDMVAVNLAYEYLKRCLS